MKEKGFAPIIILLGALIVTAVSGGAAYYSGIIPNSKLISNLPFNNAQVETTSTNPPSSNSQAVTSTPIPSITIKSSPNLPLAIATLKNRLSQAQPTLTPTPTPTSKPTPTTIPTTPPTPTPICNISSTNTNTTITSNTNGAVLSLFPVNGSYKKGENFSLNLNLDSKGHDFIGVDALLQFNPSQLSIISIIGVVGPYNQHNFSQDTFNNSNGRIYLSFTDNGINKIFKGSLTLAIINFKVNNSASGNLEVKFDFDPNDPLKTTDSNLVNLNTSFDELGVVINGFYTIKPDDCN